MKALYVNRTHFLTKKGTPDRIAASPKNSSPHYPLLGLEYDIQADPTTKLTVPGIDLDQYAHTIGQIQMQTTTKMMHNVQRISAKKEHRSINEEDWEKGKTAV